jgi:hypothetical protein
MSSTRARSEPVAVEEIGFSGHPMVLATHARTIEITTEEHLTPRGDCIVGVRAKKGLADISAPLKRALVSDASRVRFTFKTPGGDFSFMARGSLALTFEDKNDIVIRKSQFVCGRTIAVGASCAASDLPRTLVGSLKSPDSAGLLRIEALA